MTNTHTPQEWELKQFILESNKIEGEFGLNPNDLEVAERATVIGFDSLNDILEVHGRLTEHLKVEWSGKWRTVEVRVGSSLPPSSWKVPVLMEGFLNRYEEMDSWEAHNDFERIHPFQDFNGRMGRLIWLSKAVREGYDFSVPFLQKFYYQTLSHQ